MQPLKLRFRALADPLARGLVALGVSANALTFAGFLLSCLAGGVIATGGLALGGVLFVLFSSFDFLDGAVARLSGTAGPFGAFFDSVLDRASEAAVLVGLSFWFASQQQAPWAALCGAVLTGSFMVSYTRARAEGLGYNCEVGWGQRPERIVALGVALMLSFFSLVFLQVILAGLGLLTVITTAQRIRHVARVAGAGPAEPPRAGTT